MIFRNLLAVIGAAVVLWFAVQILGAACGLISLMIYCKGGCDFTGIFGG